MVPQFLTVFLLLLATSESRSVLEIKQWMITKALSCSTESPVSGAELQMLLSHKIPESKSAKCFTACVFKKIGWLNDKGVFDEDQVNQFAEKEYTNEVTKLENTKKLFDICKSVNEMTDGTEGCERAYNLTKCLLENAAQNGFIVDLPY